MALRYVVKKRMIGFGKEKTEKYVAQNFITNTVNFKDLCDEISKVGMVPSGAVKFVLDALIDTLNINLNKGISVQLGDFGQFRPGISSESQETEAAVDSDTIRRVKIVFTPGYKFKDMLKKASTSSDGNKSDDGSESSQTSTGYVIDGSLNVRSGAGTSYKVLVVLDEGTKVNITGNVQDEDDDKWYHINVKYSGTNYDCYVYAQYIEIR